LAIGLHNLPEGLAIDVALPAPTGGALAHRHFHTGREEGMVVALALRGVGYGRWHSANIGTVGTGRTVAAVLGVDGDQPISQPAVRDWPRCRHSCCMSSATRSFSRTRRTMKHFATGGLMGRLRDHDAAGHCAVGSTATTEKENPGTQGFAGNATGKLLVSDQVMLKDRFTCGRLNCGVSSWQRLCRGWCRCRLAGACY
jgi:hypothetical protein